MQELPKHIKKRKQYNAANTELFEIEEASNEVSDISHNSSKNSSVRVTPTKAIKSSASHLKPVTESDSKFLMT